jgi:predicted PurR-regulated permease PerM
VDEPVNESQAKGITEAAETLPRRASFWRVLRVLATTVVFLSFVFWAWLLGGPGAFLGLPLTLFVVVMLDTFPETRWLANVVGVSSPEAKSEPSR